LPAERANKTGVNKIDFSVELKLSGVSYLKVACMQFGAGEPVVRGSSFPSGKDRAEIKNQA
jgi:hypothetical protein